MQGHRGRERLFRRPIDSLVRRTSSSRRLSGTSPRRLAGVKDGGIQSEAQVFGADSIEKCLFKFSVCGCIFRDSKQFVNEAVFLASHGAVLLCSAHHYTGSKRTWPIRAGLAGVSTFPTAVSWEAIIH